RQHRQQRMTLWRELQGPGDGGGVAGERALRMRDELWSPGRARGRVEQYREIDITLRGRGRRRGLVECVEAHAGPSGGDRVRADHAKLLQRGHLVLRDAGEDGGEVDRSERSL